MNKFNIFNYRKALRIVAALKNVISGMRKDIEALETVIDRQWKDIDYLNSKIPDDSAVSENACLLDSAKGLLKALECLLNETMYKNHPEQSQMAIDASKKARGES